MTRQDTRDNETLTLHARLADEREPAGQEERRPYLLIFEEESVSVAQIPFDGELVIGRSSQADVRLADRLASRRHAGLVVRAGAVTISDLDSHNGTRVNGELVTAPHRLRAGDVIAICSATLVLQRVAAGPMRRPILDEARFLGRFEEEIERALCYRPELQLLCVEIGEGESAASPSVAAALAGKLRLIDIAGNTGRRELMVLLPELSADDGLLAAKALLASLHRVAPAARAGHAACPADGCDIDTLLAGARAAAAAAPPSGLLSASALAMARDIGKRRVVVADPAMVRCYALIERLAEGDLPVLIQGEAGSGKETAAQALHAMSPRRAAPMVTFHCADQEPTRVESALFGHEKGAFPGAVASKPGLLESANKGTLFLDEVADLSPAVQEKLLRVLETGRLTRLGAARDRAVNIRFVAASQRDLPAAVRDGALREDLYSRLSAANIVLPPLRDRRREIGALARLFLAEACARLGRKPPELSPAAMRAIYVHSWPGNVRELRDAMELVAEAAREPVVRARHLPEPLLAAVEKKPAGG
jgi:two-component system response regulator AtoC